MRIKVYKIFFIFWFGLCESECKERIITKLISFFCKLAQLFFYLSDISDFAVFNEVYARYFVGKPARSCVAVKDLPKGALVEVEVIAEIV